MRLLTYLELSRYSKPQLRLLHQQMLCALSLLQNESPERDVVFLNVQHIRLFLARPDYRPG